MYNNEFETKENIIKSRIKLNHNIYNHPQTEFANEHEYRRIFVHTFGPINIRLSLSDDANNMKL